MFKYGPKMMLLVHLILFCKSLIRLFNINLSV